MRITSSDKKDNLVIPGKGLIISMGLKAKTKQKKCIKERYVIGNVSMKDI